jgi:uncharacterized protein
MFQGSWSLVTGASSGIGRELAGLIAARGGNLVLVARNEQRLTALAAELRAAHRGIDVIPHAADLTDAAQIDALLRTLEQRGITIDHLVNNAGAGSFGPFLERDGANERAQVMLNIVAPLELTRRLAPKMLGRAKAGVLNVASAAAFQPTPYMATYGATKAFLLMWSEALRAEYHQQGLRVTCVCPGATDTPFFDTPQTGRSMRSAVGATGMATVANVARAALRAYEANRGTHIVGAVNQMLVQSVRITPRVLMARVAEFLLRPRRG